MSATVYPETKQLVMPYRADVETILGSAVQRFEANKSWWLAVDHTVQTVRLLRNLGLTAPSPGLFYYDFRGKPFESQKATFDMCTISRRAYVLSEMGVGKTRAVLWAYDYLKSVGLVSKLLVVAPLSTLTTVWENEIFENFPHLRTVVLYGDKKRRQKLLASDADIYVINHDGVEVLHGDLHSRTDINAVVVDELGSYRNSRSKRWKNLAPLVQRAEYAWGLTGTPTPNAPTDAFGQAKLITPETAGWSFKQFKERTMRQAGPFKWVERPEASRIVHATLQPAVRFTRAECFDLPPTTYTTRECDIGDTARGLYKQMFDAYAVEARGHEITAANAGVKLSKLLQISAGFGYSDEGKGIYFGGLDRYKQIFELIEQSEGKVIVFATFKYMVELLAGVIGKKYAVGKITGDVSKADRDLIFQGFQKGVTPHVIVAHPQTMSHGLTLTAASTIVWATPTTSLEIYEQANARITRSGQTKNTLIAHIAGTKAEAAVYSRLKKKQDSQNVLLDLFEDSTTALVA